MIIITATIRFYSELHFFKTFQHACRHCLLMQATSFYQHNLYKVFFENKYMCDEMDYLLAEINDIVQ